MLHIVNKSAFEKNSLERCIAVAKDGSAILLIEDGVYAAKKSTNAEEMLKGAVGKISVNVLGPDLYARGFKEEDLIENITVVDYHGFVELVEKNGTVQSWM